MRAHLFRHAVVLGLITAIGPFAIDMYLPALPAVGASLGVSAEAATLSLTAFFVPFGLCQLFFGALSDVVGRKPPLYFGLALFFAASIGCALAQSIEMLAAFRALEGIGAAAAIIIPRAIVRDMYSGLDETRMMSMLMLVFSVAPLLAPLVGSFIIAALDWRAVFWMVGALAVLGFALAALLVRETRGASADARASLGELVGAYRRLLSDGRFLGLALTGGFGIGSFFVYLGNSSFVLIDHYGFSPTAYAFAFSINAAAFFASAQLNGRLGQRFGLRALVRPAASAQALTTAIMAGLYLAGVDNLLLLGAFLFVSYGFMGVYLPVTGVLALEKYGANAGAAASLMGTLHLVVGSAVIAGSSAFADGTAGPMILGIAACAALAALLAHLTLGRAAVAAAP